MLVVPEEVKTIFLNQNSTKYVRVTFPNGEHETINNENILEESLQIGESLCSLDELKFGLCEANTLKFQTIGIDYNFKRCLIRVEIGVYNSDEVYWISLGEFIVDTCDKEAGTPIREIQAYSRDYQLKVPEDYETCKRLYSNSFWYPYTAVIIPALYGNKKSELIDWVENESLTQVTSTNKILNIIYGQRTYRSDSGLVISEEYQLTFRLKETKLNDSLSPLYTTIFTTADISDTNIGKILETREQAINNYRAMLDRISRDDELYSDSDLTQVISKVFVCDNRYVDLNGYFTPYAENGYKIPKSYQIVVDVWKKVGGNVTTYTNDYGSEWQTVSNVKVYEHYTNISDPLTDKFNTWLQTDEQGRKYWESPEWYYDSEKFKELCEDYLELHAGFGCLGRDGKFYVKNINAEFAKMCSEGLRCSPEEYISNGDNVNAVTLKAVAQHGAKYAERIFDKIGTIYFDYLYHNSAEDKDEIKVGTYVYNSDFKSAYYIKGNTFLIDKNFNKCVEILNKHFIPNLTNITWTPMDITCQGMPWVESGDVIKIIDGNETRTTFVHSRTLSGIQQLLDEYVSDVAELDTSNISI